MNSVNARALRLYSRTTFVHADNNNGTADLVIVLQGRVALTATDMTCSNRTTSSGLDRGGTLPPPGGTPYSRKAWSCAAAPLVGHFPTDIGRYPA